MAGRAGGRDHPAPGAAAGGGQPGRRRRVRRRAPRRGAELPPLPALLVVVDEFSELLAQRPELIDLLVTIGRLGRSLGIHLLLASQRLDEGRLRGLDSHLSYRIALRTFSAAESRAVLGVPDAHQLPPAPGSAFLATGTGELVRFRAAYVSGPTAGRRQRPDAAGAARRAALTVPWSGRWAAAGALGAAPRGRSGRRPRCSTSMIAAMAGQGPPAHRVWLPRWAAPPLDEVLGRPAVRSGRGLAVPAARRPLHVPVGVVDRPYLQRRDPLDRRPRGCRRVTSRSSAGRGRASPAALRTVVAGPRAHPHARPRSACTSSTSAAAGCGAGRAAARRHGRRPAAAGRRAPGRRRDGRRAGPSGAAVPREPGVGSVEEFRARRAAGEFPDEPATRRPARRRRLPRAARRVRRPGGPAAAARCAGALLRPAPRGVGQPVERAAAGAQGPPRQPRGAAAGRAGRVRGGPAPRRCSARTTGPRAGGGRCPDGAGRSLAVRPGRRAASRSTGDLVAAVAAAWAGPSFAPVAVLPTSCTSTTSPSAAPTPAGPRRRHSDRRRRGRPRPGCGRPDGRSAPGVLRGRRERQDHPAAACVAHGLVARCAPDVAAHRGRRLPPRVARRGAGAHLLVYASTADAAAAGGSRHRRVVARAAARARRRPA